MPGSTGFCCYRSCDGSDITAFQELTKAILSRMEFEVWSRLRFPERRCREWLLGRLCVKRAVGVLVRRHNGRQLAPSDIEILTNEYGRPFVCEDLVEKLDYPLSVSIAHSEGVAVAIAGECDDLQSVGIDVEPVGRDCGYWKG